MARADIAIFIRRNLIKDIRDIQYVSERCLRLDLRIYNRNVIFLVEYNANRPITQMKEISTRF